MSFHPLSIQTSAAPQGRPAPDLHVLVALPDGHDILSLAILLDLLAAANRLCARPP